MGAKLEPLTILLVEDDEDDYLITRELLAAQNRHQFTLDWRQDFDTGARAIREQRHDIYLIDYRLGARTGLELVRETLTGRRLAPVLMLTGESDYEIDLEASALGVTDYLLKQELTSQSLERSIRYAVSHSRTLSDLAQTQERYALAVRAANDGIWDWDLAADRIYLSPRWHAILGLSEHGEDSDLASWFERVHRDDLPRLQEAIDAHLRGGSSHLESEHRMRHADGSWRWVLIRGLATRDPDGAATRLAGSLSDITQRRRTERQLQHDALHDALTGLPNRELFLDRVDHLLARRRRDAGAQCAVMFLDIDRFKLVNDSLSHLIGDRLLNALATRLGEVLRPVDTLARLGGDEFTILLDGVGSETAALEVAERTQRVLAPPFIIDGHELSVTASIGIALSAPGLSAADLVRNADIAMYAAKRGGRSLCVLFDEDMRRRVIDRMVREHDLRRAVEQGLLEVHYQPIVELCSGCISAVEALVRWPAGWSPCSPLEFITIAEETGMIGAVGLHVLRTALGALARWRGSRLIGPDVRVSVNVSARQLDDPGLPERLREALAEAELPADALRLEITESTLMRDPERIREVLAAICATGAALDLDDFGTGYSSLAVLHRFPLQALKVDRSFVASVGAHGGGEVIVRSIVALAHSLGQVAIAEGIETAEQLEQLRALGCELGQGFLFSRPLPATQLEQLLRSWSARPGCAPARA
jgi:diguanylate cyclase (GGDEF)-like protein/PAS domain S-box-containing protein